MKQYWNKTKVICTIGPACRHEKIMKNMIISGMDIARFNFSHGQVNEHIALIGALKKLASRLKSPVAILQDLPGPKIRIGRLKNDFVELKEGQRFFLSFREIIGDEYGVSVNSTSFMSELRKKDIVYLNDGLVKLVVISRGRKEVWTEVLTGGRIYPKKGVNCPGRVLRANSVTRYDLKCLKYGIKAGVDFVAVSFVQKADDILKVKKFLNRMGKDIFVIAKIERKVAFLEIDKIIAASDAIMIARGDLGIEAALEEVPFLQKEIITKCNQQGKPVITATQMLESMTNSPQPTRAEVTDVANAIIDGSDALMLSEETAVGKYPQEALKFMLKIAAKTEMKLRHFSKVVDYRIEDEHELIESFSAAAVNVADRQKAELIVIPTQNASSVSWLSRLRPESTVVGITTKESVYKKLILFWGVYPIMIKKFSGLQQTLNLCVKLAKYYKLAKKGEKIVIMLTKDNFLFSSNIMEVREID